MLHYPHDIWSIQRAFFPRYTHFPLAFISDTVKTNDVSMGQSGYLAHTEGDHIVDQVSYVLRFVRGIK